jgi:hypothetical protein
MSQIRRKWEQRARMLKENRKPWFVGGISNQSYCPKTGKSVHYVYGPKGEDAIYYDDEYSSGLAKAVIHAETFNKVVEVIA